MAKIGNGQSSMVIYFDQKERERIPGDRVEVTYLPDSGGHFLLLIPSKDGNIIRPVPEKRLTYVKNGLTHNVAFCRRPPSLPQFSASKSVLLDFPGGGGFLMSKPDMSKPPKPPFHKKAKTDDNKRAVDVLIAYHSQELERLLKSR